MTIELVAASAVVAGSLGGWVPFYGAGFDIPDGDPNGATSTISVSGGDALTHIRVTLTGLFHSNAGDLSATVTNPGGSTQSLFFRVGSVAGGPGASAAYSGDYTLQDYESVDRYTPFTGDGNLWNAASSADPDGAIADGFYRATGAGSADQVFLLAAFGGASVNGEWTLTIRDHSGGESGELTGWKLDIKWVPAPSALLVFGGLVGWARPRRPR